MSLWFCKSHNICHVCLFYIKIWEHEIKSSDLIGLGASALQLHPLSFSPHFSQQKSKTNLLALIILFSVLRADRQTSESKRSLLCRPVDEVLDGLLVQKVKPRTENHPRHVVHGETKTKFLEFLEKKIPVSYRKTHSNINHYYLKMDAFCILGNQHIIGQYALQYSLRKMYFSSLFIFFWGFNYWLFYCIFGIFILF